VYPRRNVLTSALGIHRDPLIETYEFQLLTGDRIFLTSDGLHQKIRLRELFELSQKSSTPDHLAKVMRKAMLMRNPDDNYTFATVFVH
jgi:PPM family protein phosphatase